jgi:hypothetical protein
VKRQAPFLVIVNGPIRRPGTQIPVERGIDELGVMLAERFPDQEFVFAEGKERRPSSAVVVVPIVGTLGEAGRDPRSRRAPSTCWPCDVAHSGPTDNPSDITRQCSCR